MEEAETFFIGSQRIFTSGAAIAGYEASRHGDTGLHVSLQLVATNRGARPGTIVAALREVPGVEPERVE